MMNVIPIVVNALGIIAKGLEKKPEKLEIREKIWAFYSTTLLRLARILKRILENRGQLLSLSFQLKTTSCKKKKVRKTHIK